MPHTNFNIKSFILQATIDILMQPLQAVSVKMEMWDKIECIINTHYHYFIYQ